MGLADLIRLAERAPDAVKAIVDLDSAFNDGRKLAGVKGGLATMGMHLYNGGWNPALRAVSPELHGATEAALPAGRQALATFLQHLNGGPPPVDDTPPWNDLIRHMFAKDSGVIVILGAKGFGKSVLGLRLAWQFRKRFGYAVDTVGLWDDDVPPWANKIGMERLIRRTRKIGSFLGQEDGAVDDGLTDDDVVSRSKKKGTEVARHINPNEIERMKRRVVLVDEAEMFFTGMGGAGQEGTRSAARNLNNQARHLQSWFIFITQNMAAMPTYLRGSGILLYKWASPEVVKMDFVSGQWRSNRERWTEVLTALKAIKTGAVDEPLPDFIGESAREAIYAAARAHDIHWAPPYKDIRAWSYCVAGDIGGHSITTVVPAEPWQADPDALLARADESDDGDVIG